MRGNDRSLNRRSFMAVGGTLAGGLALDGVSVGAQARGGETTYPIVQTAAGRIRGLARNGVSRFSGVYYGASTAGARRFLPPAKPEPWTGVRDALTFAYRSPQPWRNLVPEMGDALTGTGPMSEDLPPPIA